MSTFDKFRKKMTLRGNNLREERINDIRESIKFSFKDDPSYSSEVYYYYPNKKKCSDNNLDIKLFNRRFSEANGTMIDFIVYYDSDVFVGDMFKIISEDSYYICSQIFNQNNTHKIGKLMLCNTLAKWQNKKGEIFEYPTYAANTTQYNSGEFPNKYVTNLSAQHSMLLPYDENTVSLRSPQRFYLDRSDNPFVYKVTQNDTVTYERGTRGMVRLTLLQDVESENDRKDLYICDYIDTDIKTDTKIITNISNETSEDVTPTNVDISIDKDKKENTIKITKANLIYNDNTIRVGGKSQTYSVEFYDDKNKKLDDVVAKWNIISDFKNKIGVTEVNSNTIKLSINDKYKSLIKQSFKIEVSDKDNSITTSLIVNILPKF